MKRKMNCFNCEKVRACKLCLDLISQEKTYSTAIKLLKSKPAKKNHQMLPHYEGVYEPKHNIFDFESAREILMKEVSEMFVKRRFEMIYIMVESKSYIKRMIFPKTKRYLFMDSNIMKQRQSINIY